ncbi:WD40 repeat domain-containing protein [Nonomuraea sp. NPDC050310]|uniref:WD40 repeat domain-containing protein n=1 Tax=Nonomuraea sp. NPDC050310 TaxID=3154935 RepID=UPI003408B849
MDGYGAFISYSHRGDGAFAPQFQRLLEGFGAHGRRGRSLRIFRDDANLAANAALWSSIETALAASEWLVLLARPESAASAWVGREIEWWRQNRSADRLLIGLTDGEIAWDGAAGDFDWVHSTAVHPALRGAFEEEPRWIDLRGVRALPRLDSGNPRVQEILAEFSSPLRGMEKDELLGEHLDRLRREIRRTRGALVVLVALLMGAAGAGVFAFMQANRANEEANVARARLLSATAERDSGEDSSRSQLLAAEGYRLHRDSQTLSALFRTLNDNPSLVRQAYLSAEVTAVAASGDGRVAVAGAADGTVIQWNLQTSVMQKIRLAPRPVTDVGISRDGSVIAAANGRAAVIWRPGADPKPLAVPAAHGVAVSESGVVAIVSDPEIRPQRLAVFDGERSSMVQLGDGAWWGSIGMPDDRTVVVLGANGRWQRWNIWERSLEERSTEEAFPPSYDVAAAAENGKFFGYMKLGWVVIEDTSRPGAKPRFSGHGGPQNITPTVFAISQDGKWVLTGSADELWLSSASTDSDARLTAYPLAGAGGAARAAFSGVEGRLITAKGRILTLWDRARRSRLQQGWTYRVPEVPGAGGYVGLAVSPDGRKAALVGPYGEVLVHELDKPDNGLGARTLDGAKLAFWRSADELVVAGNGLLSYIQKGELESQQVSDERSDPLAAVPTADGKGVVIAYASGALGIHPFDGFAVNSVVHPGFGTATYAAVSADTRFAAFVEQDGKGRIVTAESGLSRPIPGEAEGVAFHDDYLLISRPNGSLDVYGRKDLRLIHSVAGRHGYIGPLTGIPGTSLVARMRNDGTAIIYDLRSGALVGSLNLPQNQGFTSSPWHSTTLLGYEGQLLTATPGGVLARWTVSERGWLDTVCDNTQRDLTPGEWKEVTGTEAPGDLRCRR